MQTAEEPVDGYNGIRFTTGCIHKWNSRLDPSASHSRCAPGSMSGLLYLVVKTSSDETARHTSRMRLIPPPRLFLFTQPAQRIEEMAIVPCDTHLATKTKENPLIESCKSSFQPGYRASRHIPTLEAFPSISRIIGQEAASFPFIGS